MQISGANSEGAPWSNTTDLDPFDSYSLQQAPGARPSGVAQAVAIAKDSGNARLKVSSGDTRGDRRLDIEITRVQGESSSADHVVVAAHDVVSRGLRSTAHDPGTTYEGLTGLSQRDVFYERI